MLEFFVVFYSHFVFFLLFLDFIDIQSKQIVWITKKVSEALFCFANIFFTAS